MKERSRESRGKSLQATANLGIKALKIGFVHFLMFLVQTTKNENFGRFDILPGGKIPYHSGIVLYSLYIFPP